MQPVAFGAKKFATHAAAGAVKKFIALGFDVAKLYFAFPLESLLGKARIQQHVCEQIESGAEISA